jgi:hypothetical protein
MLAALYKLLQELIVAKFYSSPRAKSTLYHSSEMDCTVSGSAVLALKQADAAPHVAALLHVASGQGENGLGFRFRQPTE